MSIESSYESSHHSVVDEQPKKCFCGVPVAILTSSTHDNPGRRFERCKFSNPSAGMGGCRWFRWHDRVQTEWQKDIINKMKMEKRVNEYEVGCLSREIQWLKDDRKKLQFEIENLKNKAFMSKCERATYCKGFPLAIVAAIVIVFVTVIVCSK
ncbi:uncharacterized protein At1g43920, Chloroplastic-like [Silene latifolia]|uniref:uncharacterized protein At1g43920, Chloroplastic-like n=1 Tax=Silene latifolia TaxID=37657 RepID=UPI003D779D0E